MRRTDTVGMYMKRGAGIDLIELVPEDEQDLITLLLLYQSFYFKPPMTNSTEIRRQITVCIYKMQMGNSPTQSIPHMINEVAKLIPDFDLMTFNGLELYLAEQHDYRYKNVMFLKEARDK